MGVLMPVLTKRSGHWMETFKRNGANLEDVSGNGYVADVLVDFLTR